MKDLRVTVLASAAWMFIQPIHVYADTYATKKTTVYCDCLDVESNSKTQ